MGNCVAVPALQLARILAPVDFSQRCRRAARDAASLARHFGAELVLLHAAAPTPIAFGPTEGFGYAAAADLTTDYLAELTPALEEFLAEELQGVSTRRVLVQGDPAGAIADYTAERPCDLIVMPTHGYGALHRIVAGSVTTEVLRHAPCPVWTGCHFDDTPGPSRCRTVLSAVGLTQRDELAENWAAGLAAAFKAAFQIVAAPNNTADVDYIAATAAAANADVLVVGRGPKVYSIVRAAACPVVAV